MFQVVNYGYPHSCQVINLTADIGADPRYPDQRQLLWLLGSAVCASRRTRRCDTLTGISPDVIDPRFTLTFNYSRWPPVCAATAAAIPPPPLFTSWDCTKLFNRSQCRTSEHQFPASVLNKRNASSPRKPVQSPCFSMTLPGLKTGPPLFPTDKACAASWYAPDVSTLW